MMDAPSVLKVIETVIKFCQVLRFIENSRYLNQCGAIIRHWHRPLENKSVLFKIPISQVCFQLVL